MDSAYVGRPLTQNIGIDKPVAFAAAGGLSSRGMVYLAWTGVGISLLLDLWITRQNVLVLFLCARNATVAIVDRWHYR